MDGHVSSHPYTSFFNIAGLYESVVDAGLHRGDGFKLRDPGWELIRITTDLNDSSNECGDT